MVTEFELGKRLGRHSQKRIESNSQPANIGVVLSSGAISARGDDTNIKKLPNNKCYVRLYNAAAQVQVVLVGGVTPWKDFPVMVSRNFRGELKIDGPDWSRAWEYLGELMNTFATPPADQSVGFSTYPLANVSDSRLNWADTSALTIKVGAFYYPYFDTMKYWNGATALDLTSYLPSTSSQWGWAYVCIDPKDNSLTAVAGPEFTLKTLLTRAELLTIDTSGLIPIAGVTLQEGQTAYNSAKNTIEQARGFVGQYNPLIETEIGTALIGASRQHSVERTLLASGSLEIKGTLKVA